MEIQTKIINFIKDHTGIDEIYPNSDLFGIGITGDDFYEMLEKYSKTYDVDMSEFLWYFHADEESRLSIGSIFFKPPPKRVKRIPISPQLLSKFAETKRWKIDYPEHRLPTKRLDIIINKTIIAIIIVGILLLWLTK